MAIKAKAKPKAKINLEELLALPKRDKLRIAQKLLTSMTPPLSEKLKAELDRRMALSDADPSRLIPWNDVKAELNDYCKHLVKKRA